LLLYSTNLAKGIENDGDTKMIGLSGSTESRDLSDIEVKRYGDLKDSQLPQ